MADENEPKEQQDVRPQEEATPQEEASEQKPAPTPILQWIILAVIVVGCAGSGFVIGRLFAGSPELQTTEPSQQAENTELQNLKNSGASGEAKKAWYYDLTPVVACLNEPSVTRYVRATLTLEVSQEVDKQKGQAFLDGKKPVLTNWLTIYLASLAVEDVRGDKNLKRIQAQVLDAFNETLFPNAKPQIKHILFKEFAVQ